MSCLLYTSFLALVVNSLIEWAINSDARHLFFSKTMFPVSSRVIFSIDTVSYTHLNNSQQDQASVIQQNRPVKQEHPIHRSNLDATLEALKALPVRREEIA